MLVLTPGPFPNRSMYNNVSIWGPLQAPPACAQAFFHLPPSENTAGTKNGTKNTSAPQKPVGTKNTSAQKKTRRHKKNIYIQPILKPKKTSAQTSLAGFSSPRVVPPCGPPCKPSCGPPVVPLCGPPVWTPYGPPVWSSIQTLVWSPRGPCEDAPYGPPVWSSIQTLVWTPAWTPYVEPPCGRTDRAGAPCGAPVWTARSRVVDESPRCGL